MKGKQIALLVFLGLLFFLLRISLGGALKNSGSFPFSYFGKLVALDGVP